MEESAGSLQWDFLTLMLIYLRQTELKGAAPDRGAGQGYAGWLKLSTGAQTRAHTLAPNGRGKSEAGLLLYFNKASVFLDSP